MAKRKSKKRAKGYLLPRYQTKGRVVPTRQDSLFLLGNNQIIDNYLKKGAKWTHKDEVEDDWENRHHALVSDLKDFIPREIEDYRESTEKSQDERRYYESRHGTKKGDLEDYIDKKGKFTGAKDWVTGGGEDINFPFQYLHPQIKPTFQGDLEFDNRAIYSYGYKDLAITPWDMIPDDKQEERVRKYGLSGVPDSYINPKPIPITSSTYKFEQRDSKNIDRFDYYTEETKDGKVKYFKKEKNTFQYGGPIPRYQTEGRIKTYKDPSEFIKASKAFEDSAFAAHVQQDVFKDKVQSGDYDVYPPAKHSVADPAPIVDYAEAYDKALSKDEAEIAYGNITSGNTLGYSNYRGINPVGYLQAMNNSTIGPFTRIYPMYKPPVVTPVLAESMESIPVKSSTQLQTRPLQEDRLTPTAIEPSIKPSIEFLEKTEYSAADYPMIDAKSKREGRPPRTNVPKGYINRGDNKGRIEINQNGGSLPKYQNDGRVQGNVNDWLINKQELEDYSEQYNRMASKCQSGKCLERAAMYYDQNVAGLLGTPKYNTIKDNAGIGSSDPAAKDYAGPHARYEEYGHSPDSWDIHGLLQEKGAKQIYAYPLKQKDENDIGTLEYTKANNKFKKKSLEEREQFFRDMKMPIGSFIGLGMKGGSGGAKYGTTSYNKEKGLVPSNHSATVVGYDETGLPYIYDWNRVRPITDTYLGMMVTNITAPKEVEKFTYDYLKNSGELADTYRPLKLKVSDKETNSDYDPDEFDPFIKALEDNKLEISNALGIDFNMYDELAKRAVATAISETEGGNNNIWRFGAGAGPLGIAPSYITDKLGFGNTTGITQINEDLIWARIGTEEQRKGNRMPGKLNALGIEEETYDPWDPEQQAKATIAFLYDNLEVGRKNLKKGVNKETGSRNSLDLPDEQVGYYQWFQPDLMGDGVAWGESEKVKKFAEAYAKVSLGYSDQSTEETPTELSPPASDSRQYGGNVEQDPLYTSLSNAFQNGGEVESYQGGTEVVIPNSENEEVVPMQQELPHQEIVSFPTEREPAGDPRVPRFASAQDYYTNLENTPVPKTISKKYKIWEDTYKSPMGLPIKSYKNIYDIQAFFNSGNWKESFKNIENYRKSSHPMIGAVDPKTNTFIPSEENLNTNEEIASHIDINAIPVNFKKVERIPINPDGFAPGSATEFADKVVIPSGNITMKDMQEPILANGEVLMPGDEAQFDTDYVVEEKLPKAQDGLKVEGKKLSKKEVDDVRNFVEDDTNFVQEYPYLLPEVVVEDKLPITSRALQGWSKDHDPIAYAVREATGEAAPYVATGLGMAFAPAVGPLLGAGARGLAATGEATYGALAPYGSAIWNASIPGMSSVPGATVGNLLNAGFATHGATNIAPDALELLTNPLSLENLGNVGIDALEMAPMYRPMSKMLGELGTVGRVGKSSKPTSAAEAALLKEYLPTGMGIKGHKPGDALLGNYKNVLDKGYDIHDVRLKYHNNMFVDFDEMDMLQKFGKGNKKNYKGAITEDFLGKSNVKDGPTPNYSNKQSMQEIEEELFGKDYPKIEVPVKSEPTVKSSDAATTGTNLSKGEQNIIPVKKLEIPSFFSKPFKRTAKSRASDKWIE
jgi:hypothetical protein